MLVLILACGAGTYEVVSSFKVKRPLLFRVKRFLSRTALASAYILCLYVLWSFFTLLLSSPLKEEYIVLLSLVIASLMMFILVANRRTRPFIKKLTMEES